jgi:hypothetical protein
MPGGVRLPFGLPADPALAQTSIKSFLSPSQRGTLGGGPMKAPPNEGGASQGRGMMSRLKDTPRISAINDYRVTQKGLSTNQENVA